MTTPKNGSSSQPPACQGGGSSPCGFLGSPVGVNTERFAERFCKKERPNLTGKCLSFFS